MQATSYGLSGPGQPRNCCQIPGISMKFFSVLKCPTRFWDPSSFLFSRYGEHSPGGKTTGTCNWPLSSHYCLSSEDSELYLHSPYMSSRWTGIAQSVQRLATGSTVRGSNPGQARFSAPVRAGPGTHPANLDTGYRVFLGDKMAGPWRWPPTPSSAEVKDRAELHLHSLSGSSCPLLGWTGRPLP